LKNTLSIRRYTAFLPVFNDSAQPVWSFYVFLTVVVGMGILLFTEMIMADRAGS